MVMADEQEQGPRPRRVARRFDDFPRPQPNGANAYGAANGERIMIAIFLLVLCAFLVVIPFRLDAAGWNSSEQQWVKEEDVRKFRHLIDVMANNDLEEIGDLAAIIDAARQKIDDKLDTFLSSGIAKGRWQENVIDKASEVQRLYGEAIVSVFEFALHGRSLMQDMVNHVVDDLQRAFDQGNYEIICMRLDDVKDHLTEAHKALETAKAKMKNAASTSDDILKLINIKLTEKVTSAEDAKQGWSPVSTTILYSLGMAFGAGFAALAPFAIPVAAGAASGAGLTGFYQFMDALKREDLSNRLYSEARELSAAGSKVRNAKDILNQCVLGVTQLEVAVGEAQQSTNRMRGYLRPADAKLFRTRLRDAKHKYIKPLAMCEQTVESIQSGSVKSKRLT